MKAPLSYLPALPAAVGLVAGILGAPHVPVWVVAGVFMAMAVALYLWRRHYVALLVFFASVGLVTERAHRPYELPQDYYNRTVTVQAVVESARERGRSNIEFVRITAINGTPMPKVLCQLSVMTGHQPHPDGAVISTKCRLEPVQGGVVLPYQTDYDRYLHAEGITCKAFVRGDDITVLSVDEALTGREGRPRPGSPDGHYQYPSLWPYRTIQSVRDWLYDSIVLSPVDSQTASFLVATILGDRSLLSQGVTDAFRDTGVAHLLALSGLHVGILVWLFAVLLFPLGTMRRGRVARSVLTVAVVWCYAVIVGMSPSIVRAAVMITVFIAARHVQRGYNAWNSLLLSIILILCICPGWLVTPGFQLSVAAVASILAFGTFVPCRLKRKPWLYYPLNMLLIPVAAMIGTGIVGAYYFGTFPLWFLVSNVITGILFPPMVAFGVVMMVFTGCGVPIVWMGTVVQCLYHALHDAVMWLDGFDGMTITGLTPSVWTVVLYLLTVALAALALNWGRFPLPSSWSRLTRRSLWIYSAAMLVLTFAAQRLSGLGAPRAEFYVSGDSYSTEVVLISSGQALLYHPGVPSDQPVEISPSLLRYARSRGADSVALVTASFRLPPFALYCQEGRPGLYCEEGRPRPDTANTAYCIIAGENLITLITSDALPVFETTHTPTLTGREGRPRPGKVSYALITRGFTGSIADIVTRIHPDTILLGTDIYPLRRARFIRECSDSVPFRDLRTDPLSLRW